MNRRTHKGSPTERREQMKSSKMAWVLGGLSAFALGIAAQACSSSSASTGVDGGGGGGTSCASLSTCCATLGASGSQCTSTIASKNDNACAALLTMIVADGECTGVSPTPDGSTPIPDSTIINTPDTGSGTPDTGAPPGNDTGTPIQDAGAADCHKAPPNLHPEIEAGVYCPFSEVGDAGNLYCKNGQSCCITPYSTPSIPSTCNTGACPVTGSTVLECEGTPDCASKGAGNICCGFGSIKTQAACGTIAPYSYVSGFAYGTNGVKGTGGSFCATSCAQVSDAGASVSTFQICSQTSECPTGSTCTPIEPSGVGLGYCTGTNL
jgi:hypothetical protein